MIDHSKDDLQSFNPAAPDYRWKLWVRVVTPDHIWFHIYWGRIAATAFGLMIATWLGTAAGVWGFVKYQRGYGEVSYLDLAFYPWRRDSYRTGLGEHYLKLGRQALEQQNYREGYSLLQAGVARAPNDIAGRRLLAFTQIRFGRADLALRTLTEGAELASADLDYLKLLFALLLESREDQRVIELAKSLLPAAPTTSLSHLFIALQAATAHFERGRYDEAEQFIATWGLGKSLEGSILLAKCDWERGFRELALVRLESEIARFPKRDELYLYLVRYHRELGHNDEARRFALLRQFNDPASPGPRIDLLFNYHNTDDRTAEAREVGNFLRDFSNDQKALQLLAWFAVDSLQPNLTERLVTLANERSFDRSPFDLARVQVYLATGDYPTALRVAQNAAPPDADDAGSQGSLIHGLRAIALYGLKEVSRADVVLNSFLSHASLRAGDAMLLAKQLVLVAPPGAARAVLDRACVLDPQNQAALGELIRLDATSGNREKLAENLPKYLRMRKPSRAVLQETILKLDQPTDAPLREQIRAALARASATPAP